MATDAAQVPVRSILKPETVLLLFTLDEHDSIDVRTETIKMQEEMEKQVTQIIKSPSRTAAQYNSTF